MPDPDDNRRLLEAAGYTWDQRVGSWKHPKSTRALHGEIARTLDRDLLVDWIKAGVGRESS